MDFDGISEVANALNLKLGRPHTSPDGITNVSMSCPLAPWRHQNPHDENMSCSVSVNGEVASLAKCYSFNCAFTGTFLRLVRTAIHFTEPMTDVLRDLLLKVTKQEEMTLERLTEAADKKMETVGEKAREPIALPAGPRAAPRTTPKHHDRDALDEDTLSRFQSIVPRYVVERGITPETAKAWGLCFDARTDRVVFPVRRLDGLLVGMTGRILPEREKVEEELGRDVTKYHNYSGLNKTRYLFGEHLFVREKPVIVTEGPFDALKTWQALHGRANVCATLGQGFSNEHQRTILWVQPPDVYIFLDNDPAGRAGAGKVASQLEHMTQLRLMRPFSGKDPGAMSEADITAAFEQADLVLGADTVWMDIPL